MQPIAQAPVAKSLSLFALPSPRGSRSSTSLWLLVCAIPLMFFSGCAAEDATCYRPAACYRPGRDEASRLGVAWATIYGQPFTITHIFPESNAYAAGLRIGDQILASNGIDMHEPAAIAQYFRIPPGSKVGVTYFHRGLERHTVVTTIPLAPWQR